MSKKIDLITEIIFFVFFGAVIGMLVIGGMTLPDERQPEVFRSGVLDISWNRIMEDGSLEPVDVPGKCSAEQGETVTVTAVMPEGFGDGFQSPWLCLRSSKQDMRVFIDGVLREEYTTEKTRLWGKNSVSAYIFVPLSENDYGKSITVSLTSFSDYSGTLREVRYGTVLGMWLDIAKGNIFEAISGLFIMVFAVGSIIVDGILSIKRGNKFALGFLGWGIFFLSLWILSQSPLRQFYFHNVSLSGDMTYFSLYLFSVPMAIFMNYTQKMRYAKFYRPLILVLILFFGASLILQAAGIADFFRVLPVMHFLFAAEIIGAVTTLVLDIRHGYIKEYILIAYGFLGFAVSGVFQVILYLQKNIIFSVTIICVGALFLLIMASVSTIKEYFRLGREVENNRIRTENLTCQIMETLVHTIEAKDEYTKGHSTRVAEYSRLLAEKMGMSEEEKNSLYFMASLHDIGKIGIADSIINKPGKLTDEEYAVIKTHPEVGFNILRNMSEIKDIEYGARWHHERYDGKGYPDGLSGEKIPVYARIIAVADVYDAMTSNRSYRQILPQEEVKKEIERVKGTQLDPVIAGYMIELIDSDKDYELRQKQKN